MKTKFLSVIIALVLAGSVKAQSAAGTITIFTEEGEQFTVFYNGIKESETPQARVQFAVQEPIVSVRVVFADATVPPLEKKSLMRGGIDCTYMISKNKKGEYTMKVKSCTGQFSAPPPPPTAMAPAAAAAPSAPITCTHDGDYLRLSDGRFFSITKKLTHDMTGPKLFMRAPDGANVTITYDNGDHHSSQVPFDYTEDNYHHYNEYFKLTVDEGGPNKTWSVKLLIGTGYGLTIE